MWHPEYRLYLYPVERDKSIPTSALITALQTIEFISEPLKSNHADRYKVGEEFLSLICFMGCSPNIEIEPQKDSPFCYIEIGQERGKHSFIAGSNVKKANCPQCKKTQPKLAKNLLSHPDKIFQQVCDSCGKMIDLTKINWRKSAFIATTWVLLGNIYEAEALPDEKLLSALQHVSGCDWKYAYIQIKS
jgi:hypothetical protein